MAITVRTSAFKISPQPKLPAKLGTFSAGGGNTPFKPVDTSGSRPLIFGTLGGPSLKFKAGQVVALERDPGLSKVQGSLHGMPAKGVTATVLFSDGTSVSGPMVGFEQTASRILSGDFSLPLVFKVPANAKWFEVAFDQFAVGDAAPKSVVTAPVRYAVAAK